MLLVAYFTSLLLFCRQTVAVTTEFTFKPPNQAIAIEAHDFTLMWNYTLGRSILSARILNVTGVRNEEEIARRELNGPTIVISNYQLQGRFSANISDTHAWLKILQVQRSDQGKYKFDLVLRGSGGINHEVEVIVHSLANFTKVSNDATLLEGSDLKLFCKASGRPSPTVTWVRIFPSGTESNVLQTNDTWEFKEISRNQAGIYRCTAANGVGNPVSHKIRVTVKFSAETKLQAKYFVGREKNVSLLCQVEGYPTPSITWTPCKPDGTVCVERRLKISNVKEDNTYNCTAQNELGSNSSITIVVIGANVINLTLTITSETCTEGDTSFWSKLEEPVTKLFKGKNGFTDVTLKSHRCGSLIVNLVLKFKEIVSETWVLDTLRNATKNNKLGELSVNSSSIAGIAVIESTGTKPTEETTKEPASDDNTVTIIVAIVVPIAAAIIVGVILYIIWKKKKDKKKINKEVGDKNPGGQKMKQIGGRSSDGHGNNGYENTGSSSRRPEKAAEITYTVVEQDKENSMSRTSGGGPKKPPRSFEAETQQQSVDGRNKAKKSKKEQAQEKPVGVVYAQVDKTKKKPKKPEATYDQAERPGSKGPGDLTYAMLEHGQGSSMPRNAASQVKKPKPYVETEYAMIV